MDSQSLTQKTVLIIEDDQDYRKLLKDLLEKEGFVVKIAQDGEQALKFVTTGQKIHLILLDLFMPKMDGVMFYYTLREKYNKNVPVVILTNLTGTTYPEGVKELIIKSNISPGELVDKVKKYTDFS